MKEKRNQHTETIAKFRTKMEEIDKEEDDRQQQLPENKETVIKIN